VLKPCDGGTSVSSNLYLIIYYFIRQVPGLHQCHEFADIVVDNADEDDLNDILTTRASHRCPANREVESPSTSNTGSSASTGASSVSNLDLHNTKDNAEDNLSVLSSIDDRATSPHPNKQVNVDINAKDGQVASLPIIATPKAGGKGKKATRGRGKKH